MTDKHTDAVSNTKKEPSVAEESEEQARQKRFEEAKARLTRPS